MNFEQILQAPKKLGPPLGTGSPEGAFQMLVSFSHQRVGSSILASLSEAGGNESPDSQVTHRLQFSLST